MNKYLYFGEEVEGYDIPVINEREARAAAGILFLFGMISFFNAYLLFDFKFTQIFVSFFMLDFSIRVLINPKYAPSLILAKVFVSNQKPEYVGASQKRFAWSIGLLLSIPMFFMIILFDYMTPIKIVICFICLALLFSEAAFGICLGCKIYHFIHKEKAQHCPGGICEIKSKDEIQRISKLQLTILIFVLLGVTTVTATQFKTEKEKTNIMKCQSGKCGSSN